MKFCQGGGGGLEILGGQTTLPQEGNKKLKLRRKAFAKRYFCFFRVKRQNSPPVDKILVFFGKFSAKSCPYGNFRV